MQLNSLNIGIFFWFQVQIIEDFLLFCVFIVTVKALIGWMYIINRSFILRELPSIKVVFPVLLNELRRELDFQAVRVFLALALGAFRAARQGGDGRIVRLHLRTGGEQEQ